jgi:hypothetical protein
MKKNAIAFIAIIALSFSVWKVHAQDNILNPKLYKHYIDDFNYYDNELYKEYIPNDQSWAFLSTSIPLFDCPDKQIEKTYYFRWWTYRKHIKKTENGFVITEFLPDVPWAGKYNTISCPAGHHFYEGRWLKNNIYLNDYAKFWFSEAEHIFDYSFWAADALYNYYLSTHDNSLLKKLLPDLVRYYESREKNQLDSNGLFWQVDGRDGMEESVCGSGYRATINSYMYGDASAISKIALMTCEHKLANRFLQKAATLKKIIQDKLWDKNDHFFKVLPREDNELLCNAKELHGYTPWYFNVPDSSYSVAWKYIMSPTYFYAPFGLTTVEQYNAGFNISYEGHECQWRGPSWPFASAITLTAMANLLNNYTQDYVSKKDYLQLLKDYSTAQQITSENGEVRPWIDENLNPYTGDWIARTRLKSWENNTWSVEKGGVERGKDYNHSTFCDLIITGLIGLRPQEEGVVINPLLPDNSWTYFCLDNISYHGKILTVLYDKTGNQYHRGKGLMVFVNGKLTGKSQKLGTIKLMKI